MTREDKEPLGSVGMADDASAIEPPVHPAAHRRCEVCREPGADTPTRMFVADSGSSHTSYAHRDCAEATGAEASAP